jgi:hypothetical protein
VLHADNGAALVSDGAAVCVFAPFAVQLLHKMSIRAADGTDTLLKVIRNPITIHLPVGARIIGLCGLHVCRRAVRRSL